MSDYNPGPASTATANLEAQLQYITKFGNNYFSLLPADTISQPGTLVYTIDQGLCYWNGSIWVSLAGSSGGATPVFQSVVSASPATTQTAYSPSGFGPTTSLLKLAAASGGSTINSLSSAGRSTGTSVFIRNTSTTDTLFFPYLGTGSTNFSSYGAGSGMAIPQNSGALAIFDVNTWVFG